MSSSGRRAFPNYYQHYAPSRIIAGCDALRRIPAALQQLGCSSAMVVTDKGVMAAGLISHIEAAFQGSGCRLAHIFDESPPDSSNVAAQRLAGLFREYRCDCFLAVGGGSALDTAKAANIVLSEKTDDLLSIQGAENIEADLIPMIAVPTTAGTGSEVTRAAIIYNEHKGVKMLFGADKLYPSVAVLDPRMTATMPPQITAATGLDALTHAMEAYINLQKNPIDDLYAKTAVELIAAYLVRAVENGGEDMEARLGMANAALFAGVAFSNAMVGVVHSLAHACGSVCHIPHGTANGILLPWGLEFNLPAAAPFIAELSGPLGAAATVLDPREQAKVTIQLVRNLELRLNTICGLPLTLQDAGVTADKLPLIARAALNDGCLIYNPIDVTWNDALEILQKAFR